MDIAPYIADLLRLHDEVNVPSLGTFYKEYKRSFFDPEKAEYLPPSHGLSFRESEDDTILTEYISKQKNISINTASYFIEKFVAQVKSLLDVYGQTDIESLGRLKKLKEGYQFTGVQNDSNGEYFGLFPVQDIKVPAVPGAVAVATQPEEDTPEELISVETPSFEETQTETQEDGKVSSISKMILTAAGLILIGIVAYLLYPQIFEMFKQKTNVPEHKIPAKKPEQPPINKTLADSLAEADTIYQELAKQGFEVEKPRDTLEVSTEISTTPKETESVTFEIIGAAFARRSEAETYIKQLKTKGVYAKIVEDMPGSKLKISLGTFNDEASAKTGLIRIQKDLNKDAWIARVKTKKTN
ncbi:SPOR domain-containing protein [Flavihumibacter sp. R14]|nr:SPOR domain-containing protein [Flavihumibacter soli]